MKLLNEFEFSYKIIRQNLLAYKQKFNDVKVCAIVKADAYSHGLTNVVLATKSLVDFYGVADSLEALKVRNVTSKPILILNMVDSDDLPTLIEQNISLSVFSLSFLNQVEKQAKLQNKIANIHIKINTGMNRLGLKRLTLFKKILEKIEQSKYLKLEGVYSHIYNSSNEKDCEKQREIFMSFLKLIDKKTKYIAHLSASEIAVKNPNFKFDMVRLGLLIYGYNSAGFLKSLKPCLKITSKIVNIINIKKGEIVGYGANFVAQKNMKIGCVAMGYADGFLRSNSNKGKVIINGEFCNVVGNVCMDLFMVDITNVDCKIMDEVVILGSQSYNGKTITITAEDLAKINQTIPYEILTNFKFKRMLYKVEK